MNLFYTVFKILLIALFFTNTALAARYFVEKTTATGVDEESTKVAIELIKSAVVGFENNQLSNDPKTTIFHLKSKIIKLGNIYIFSLEKWEDDKIRASNQMRAERIEDLDTVISRVTRATLAETQVLTDGRVSDISESEANKIPKRKAAVGRFFFGFGPAMSTNLNAQGSLIAINFGISWQTSTSTSVRVFYDGNFSTKNDSNSNIYCLGIGSTYFFKDTDISPVVLADFGFGTARRETGGADEKTDGFVLGVGGGYALFRTSKVTLEVTGKYLVMLRSNSDGVPLAFGLRVGLHF